MCRQLAQSNLDLKISLARPLQALKTPWQSRNFRYLSAEVIKIMHSAFDFEYDALRYILKFHYLGNEKVNNVYRCQEGTLMIDCRKKK